MALTFPLSISDFFKGLTVKVVSFDLSEAMINVETEGGEILTSDAGPRLWSGVVNVVAAKHREQSVITSKIQTLRQSGREFFIFDPTLNAPRLDQNGSILGAAMPTISAVATNNRELSIQGLPPSYEISAGDMISFTYGGRQALHQFVSGGTASGLGTTGMMDVVPHIRPTAPTGTVVQLFNPVCRAVLVPKSVKAGVKSRLHTDGVSFSWRQTLRVTA